MKETTLKMREWRENSDMKAVQIYLPPYLVKRLEFASGVTGKSKSEVIRHLIRQIDLPDICRKTG